MINNIENYKFNALDDLSEWEPKKEEDKQALIQSLMIDFNRIRPIIDGKTWEDIKNPKKFEDIIKNLLEQSNIILSEQDNDSEKTLVSFLQNCNQQFTSLIYGEEIINMLSTNDIFPSAQERSNLLSITSSTNGLKFTSFLGITTNDDSNKSQIIDLSLIEEGTIRSNNGTLEISKDNVHLHSNIDKSNQKLKTIVDLETGLPSDNDFIKYINTTKKIIDQLDEIVTYLKKKKSSLDESIICNLSVKNAICSPILFKEAMNHLSHIAGQHRVLNNYRNTRTENRLNSIIKEHWAFFKDRIGEKTSGFKEKLNKAAEENELDRNQRYDKVRPKGAAEETELDRENGCSSPSKPSS